MIPELGQTALILAWQLAIAQAILCFWGASRADLRVMAMGQGAAKGQFVLVFTGFAVLAWSFYRNDFSVVNVVEHSSQDLPTLYRIAATWGSHEGSMLLWALILAGWTLAVLARSRHLPAVLTSRVVGIMGLISIGFLAFILFASNPFLRLEPPPLEGMDLNPLLQDPGMVIHPPLLYMGYVGFSVAFAFALACLWSGELDAAWTRWTRPWTLLAWLFLSLGIMVGSWWAYYELGWGGWWFWDPTENASLMPWLTGTALVHALAVTDKRGQFRLWSVFLAIATFSLSLLGTFLVRSGVLSSIHAFAQDPLRGLFILGFLVITIGGSLLLFAWRAPKICSRGPVLLGSKESLLLVGNVLLLVTMATVLLGTLYPLLLDALDMGKISVGPPYFNAVFIPLMLPVLVLAGLTPNSAWGSKLGPEFWQRQKWPALWAAVAGFSIPALVGHGHWGATLGCSVFGWLLAHNLSALWQRPRPYGSRAFLGMHLAHIGLAITVLGISLISSFEREQALAMRTGDTAQLAGYSLTFKGVNKAPGPNYEGARAQIELSKNGQTIALLAPEKRVYNASRMPMTESAIHYGLLGDVYVALGDPLADDAWAVRLFYKPFASWIWLGAILMALGGGWAATDRRYRSRAS